MRIILLLCAAILFIGMSSAWADEDTPGERRAHIGFDSVLLGGFLGGQWVSADDLQGTEEHRFNRIWGGHDCRVYSSKGFEGAGTWSAMHNEHPGEDEDWDKEPNAPIFDVRMENGRTLGFGSARLAIISSWNPTPRRAASLNTKDAVYNKIVKEYLGRNGLSDAEVNIMQLFRVDLEGDGVDEVVIYAQNIFKREATATWAMDKPLFHFGAGLPEELKEGQYSLLLLRKIVGGKVHEIPLVQCISLKECTTANGQSVPPLLHKLYQFADLNGDGIMEIITGEYSFKGFAYLVYEIEGSKAVTALKEFVPIERPSS